VKDGSGALWGFVPQGKTPKAGANSLTHHRETAVRHAQISRIIRGFGSEKMLNFKAKGSPMKNLVSV
jgi:hypothetical protein